MACAPQAERLSVRTFIFVGASGGRSLGVQLLLLAPQAEHLVRNFFVGAPGGTSLGAQLRAIGATLRVCGHRESASAGGEGR